MEHVPSILQAASLGGVGLILAQPDTAHFALIATCVATLGSIVTTAINRRADRSGEQTRYQHEKEARQFQAEQVRMAFESANAARAAAEAHIVAKVEESTSASATALDASNHLTEKLANATEALRDAARAKRE